jgi:asparagine synthase (glutamine-hydrolysing)
MCGIAGIFRFTGKPVTRKSLKLMCDAMSYRGPDDEGTYLSGPLGLGHRRLSIIDLTSGGHQPMANEDGSLVVVYNGEIYNFLDLRAELETLGHTFRSRSDTEVILRSYEQWGESCVTRFNGMFAFALWDKEKSKLFLARDRYGIKPLYYFFDKNVFIFASEIKAILTSGEVARELCFDALNEYFTFQNIYSEKTLFKGVLSVPAGYCAAISWKKPDLSLKKYWDFDFSRSKTASQLPFDEASYQIRKLFEQGVTRQLISDVPLGSYLSGGMDSGSIVAVAKQSIPRLMTFTGGFDLSSVSGLEANFDERADSELMASTFRTEHYEMVMHSGDMAWIMSDLIWHIEDLRMGMSYQNWYIARLASKFVKVVLAGTGGDELFAGYPWRYKALLESRTADDFHRASCKLWHRLISEEDKTDFFTLEVISKSTCSANEVLGHVLEPLGHPAKLDSQGALARALYFEAKTFLHGLFIIEDKISMAHSLETRVPFLDNNLVDYVLTVPSEYKLDFSGLMQGSGSGPILTSDGKYILRKAMGGLIPDAILNRKKQGFSPPDESWYRGETMGYIKEILLNRKTLGRGYFRPAYIHKIVDEHTSGKVNHRLLIWSLLCFEWWNRRFMDDNTGELIH